MRKLNFILSCFFLLVAAQLQNYQSYDELEWLVIFFVRNITIGALLGWLYHRQRKKNGYSKNHILTDIAIANWCIFGLIAFVLN